MTDSHLAKMRAGAARATARRRRESVRRVAAWRTWLVEYQDAPAALAFRALADQGGYPRDHDFTVAREEAAA